MIVTGEPLAFYMKACKGQPLSCFHFAHTIIQLGGLCIFVRTLRISPFTRILHTEREKPISRHHVLHTYSVTNNVVGVTQD